MRRLRPVGHALSRDERRVAVLEQVDRGRADAAARGRAAQDHRVHALGDQNGRQVRPEEGGRALLEHDRLVLARLQARVDLHPAPADLQVAERRHLLEPEAAVLQARLVADGGEDHRQAPCPTGVEQPPGRLDLGAHVRPERAFRVGEPAAEVDDEDRGMRPDRHRLAEPRRRVDLRACWSLTRSPAVTGSSLSLQSAPPSARSARASHAVTFSAEPRASHLARLTNCPAPGSATSSSFSTIVWPRTSTTCGAPVTFVPSNRL